MVQTFARENFLNLNAQKCEIVVSFQEPYEPISRVATVLMAMRFLLVIWGSACQGDTGLEEWGSDSKGSVAYRLRV